MSDPYDLQDTPAAPRSPAGPGQTDPGQTDPGHRGEPAPAATSGARATLWVVLALSAGANAATSAAGLPIAVSVSFGVLTLVCIVALVRSHLSGKGRS